MKPGKIIIILIAACLIMLIISPFAIKAAKEKKARTQNWIKTTAEVVGFDFTVTVESEQTIISFSDESGNVHTTPLGFFSADMYIGKKVPIAYDPDDVNSIIYLGDNSGFINYGGGIILIIGGLLSGFAAVAVYIKSKRQKRFENANKE